MHLSAKDGQGDAVRMSLEAHVHTVIQDQAPELTYHCQASVASIVPPPVIVRSERQSVSIAGWAPPVLTSRHPGVPEPPATVVMNGKVWPLIVGYSALISIANVPVIFSVTPDVLTTMGPDRY